VDCVAGSGGYGPETVLLVVDRVQVGRACRCRDILYDMYMYRVRVVGMHWAEQHDLYQSSEVGKRLLYSMYIIHRAVASIVQMSFPIIRSRCFIRGIYLSIILRLHNPLRVA